MITKLLLFLRPYLVRLYARFGLRLVEVQIMQAAIPGQMDMQPEGAHANHVRRSIVGGAHALLLCFLLCGAVNAQQGAYTSSGGASTNLHGSGAPTGACIFGYTYTNDATGNFYSCNNSVWLLVGPGAAGSAAWNTLTPGTLSTAGTFAASGNTWDFSAVTLFKLRVGAGASTSANGDLAYDSTAALWHIWQGAANRSLVASTNLGTSGQPCLSNADGSCTFADPLISSTQDNNSTAAWTSATTLNTALAATVTSRSTVTVTFRGSSITGGAITFEESQDNTNWFPVFAVSADLVSNGTTYTLTGANEEWSLAVGANTNFRVRLSTVITGAGTANIGVTATALSSPERAAVIVANTPTVTANAGSGTFATSSTQLPAALDGSGFLKVHEQGTSAISAAALPLPTGAATEATLSTLNGKIPPSPATDRTTAAAPFSVELSDGAAFYAGAKETGGNLAGAKTDLDSIVTNTNKIPALGAAAKSGSVPVTLATDGDPCGPQNAKSYAFYDAATNGATQLVALSSGKVIYVCSYSFSSSSATANTLKLVYGTGSNCATGQTAMTPGIILQAAASTGPIGKVNPNSAGLQTAASNALCVLTNAAQAAQAEVSYVQQ